MCVSPRTDPVKESFLFAIFIFNITSWSNGRLTTVLVRSAPFVIVQDTNIFLQTSLYAIKSSLSAV